MDTNFEEFLNKVINEFYAIIMEDALRAGLEDSAAKAQAEQLAYGAATAYADDVKAVLEAQDNEQDALEKGLHKVLGRFCQDNELPEQAADYFLSMREDILNNKNGVMPFEKYINMLFSKFAGIIAADLGERTTKTDEEIEQVIRAFVDQSYQKNINAIRAAYTAYNADKTRLIKINTDVLKEMLRTYIKAQNLPASHIKHLMEL